jgi:hypothetical protein
MRVFSLGFATWHGIKAIGLDFARADAQTGWNAV